MLAVFSEACMLWDLYAGLLFPITYPDTSILYYGYLFPLHWFFYLFGQNFDFEISSSWQFLICSFQFRLKPSSRLPLEML